MAKVATVVEMDAKEVLDALRTRAAAETTKGDSSAKSPGSSSEVKIHLDDKGELTGASVSFKR